MTEKATKCMGVGVNSGQTVQHVKSTVLHSRVNFSGISFLCVKAEYNKPANLATDVHLPLLDICNVFCSFKSKYNLRPAVTEIERWISMMCPQNRPSN